MTAKVAHVMKYEARSSWNILVNLVLSHVMTTPWEYRKPKRNHDGL